MSQHFNKFKPLNAANIVGIDLAVMYLFLHVTCRSPVFRRTRLGEKVSRSPTCRAVIGRRGTSVDDAAPPVTLCGEPGVPFRRRNGIIVDTTLMAERLLRVFALTSWGRFVAFVGGHAKRTSRLRSPRDAVTTAGRCFRTRLKKEKKRKVEEPSRRRRRRFQTSTSSTRRPLKKNNPRKSTEDLHRAALRRHRLCVGTNSSTSPDKLSRP